MMRGLMLDVFYIHELPDDVPGLRMHALPRAVCSVARDCEGLPGACATYKPSAHSLDPFSIKVSARVLAMWYSYPKHSYHELAPA
jgi:hypothetical protein